MRGRQQAAGKPPSAVDDRLDIVLGAYRLLRLDRLVWRAVGARLAAPFSRLGRYQALQDRAWHAAVSARDCDDTCPTDCRGALCA